MKIIVDSREKWTQPGSCDRHIPAYFERHGIEWETRKLDVGDYVIEGQDGIAVDRKQHLDEISRNLMNRTDAGRFWREVRRAHEQKIRLWVLIESGPKVLDIHQVPKWKSKYSQVTGRRLIDEMIRLEMSYGVRWAFCSKASTAKRIVEILSGKEG